MDERASESAGSRNDVDLAAIVLGAASVREQAERRIDAPEYVPIDHGRHPERGYDLRSAAVLALVVAVLAAIVGWATTIGDAPSIETPKPTAAKTDEAAVVSEPAADTDAEAAAATPVPGIDLTVGRIIPARGASGSGLVTVGIGNGGDTAFAARGGGTVLVILDGEVVATEPLPAIEAGSSTRVSVPLTWCPSGTVAMTAVVDPGAVVREANERNNATSRSATFGC
jgi:hypothetical protein